MVMDGDRVAGIFTERDVLTRVVARELVPSQTRLGEVITKSPHFIPLTATVEEAMQAMTEKRARHLPVFDGERLCGMISIGDVTRWLLRVQQMEAENLRKYAFGDYPG